MGSILALGGNRIFLTKYAFFHTEFTEVSGLFVGSVISLQGLPVGNVRAINFDVKSNSLDLTLAIDERFADRIRKGVSAEIRTQGALGDKFIFLNPGEPTSEVLSQGSLIPSNDGGDFLKMISDKDQGISQVFELMKEMRILIAQINDQGRPGKVMQNMAEVTSQFKTTLASLNQILGDVHNELPKNKKLDEAVRDLASILQKIDKGQGTIGALVNDPSIHQGLKNFLGASQRESYLKNVVKETIKQSKD